MTDPNWLPSRVRRNFRIDLFSALGAGAFVSVLIAFMPVVVRRMGGSTTDVAIVVAAPTARRPASDVIQAKDPKPQACNSTSPASR